MPKLKVILPPKKKKGPALSLEFLAKSKYETALEAYSFKISSMRLN